ncbi:MAG: alginate lyase family protein, partial [Micromonosporaceae bacterium]|nr:alginate lyase family protein [Micromonosporaceae bacterium]
ETVSAQTTATGIPIGTESPAPPTTLTPAPTTVAPVTPTPTPTPTPDRHPISGFVHPGVGVSLDHLELVRERVTAGIQPWAGAFREMSRSQYADLDWQPQAREVVECGYNSNPNHGCGEEWRDAVAAYTHALLWYLTLDQDHARKAVEIIDAWASTLRAHTHDNAPLQAGWSAATLVRAAEIMRYTYAAWPSANVERAATMFRDVYLPLVRDGAPRSDGNWDFIILDAAIGIAVFLDDRPLFDHAIERWRARLPAYIYLSSDGPQPIRPPAGPVSWYGQGTFVDGLTQETCRDLGHTAWGLEALVQVAETAWIQGVDLYTEAQPRLTAALEMHAGYAQGDGVPGWLCGGTLKGEFEPIPEIAYHHYHDRLGLDLPRTRQLLQDHGPQFASHFYAWGTLTHGTR